MIRWKLVDAACVNCTTTIRTKMWAEVNWFMQYMYNVITFFMFVKQRSTSCKLCVITLILWIWKNRSKIWTNKPYLTKASVGVVILPKGLIMMNCLSWLDGTLSVYDCTENNTTWSSHNTNRSILKIVIW